LLQPIDPEIAAKKEELKKVLAKLAKAAPKSEDGKYILMYRVNLGSKAHNVRAPATHKVDCEALNDIHSARMWIIDNGNTNYVFYICTKEENKETGQWKAMIVNGEKWVYGGGKGWHTTNWEQNQNQRFDGKYTQQVLSAMAKEGST
jgi:hypothetical protein